MDLSIYSIAGAIFFLLLLRRGRLLDYIFTQRVKQRKQIAALTVIANEHRIRVSQLITTSNHAASLNQWPFAHIHTYIFGNVPGKRFRPPRDGILYQFLCHAPNPLF